MGAGGERCISRPHIGPICHCCVLDPSLHFLARIFAPFLCPDAVTQSPSPFWIVISLPGLGLGKERRALLVGRDGFESRRHFRLICTRKASSGHYERLRGHTISALPGLLLNLRALLC